MPRAPIGIRPVSIWLRETLPAMTEPRMMPMPEQAMAPWITTVLVSPRVSLAKAGNAATITWEMPQNTDRPTMESQITWFP